MKEGTTDLDRIEKLLKILDDTVLRLAQPGLNESEVLRLKALVYDVKVYSEITQRR